MHIAMGSTDFSTFPDPGLTSTGPGPLLQTALMAQSLSPGLGSVSHGACGMLTPSETPGKGCHHQFNFSYPCCCVMWSGRVGSCGAGERHQPAYTVPFTCCARLPGKSQREAWFRTLVVRPAAEAMRSGSSGDSGEWGAGYTLKHTSTCGWLRRVVAAKMSLWQKLEREE